MDGATGQGKRGSVQSIHTENAGENVRAGHGANEMGEPVVRMEGRKRPTDMSPRDGDMGEIDTGNETLDEKTTHELQETRATVTGTPSAACPAPFSSSSASASASCPGRCPTRCSA